MHRPSDAIAGRKLDDHRLRAVPKVCNDEMNVFVLLELRLHEPSSDAVRPSLRPRLSNAAVRRRQTAEDADRGPARVEVD
jgi:hypothetical protein